MLRVIVRREFFYEFNQMRGVCHYTIDIEAPELQHELERGGMGESGYEFCSVVDIEVLQKAYEE